MQNSADFSSYKGLGAFHTTAKSDCISEEESEGIKLAVMTCCCVEGLKGPSSLVSSPNQSSRIGILIGGVFYIGTLRMGTIFAFNF